VYVRLRDYAAMGGNTVTALAEFAITRLLDEANAPAVDRDDARRRLTAERLQNRRGTETESAEDIEDARRRAFG
jgi:hypothetical protein